ncbi:MAG: imidazole glycerol phosphate synthase subunit HisH [Acidimicrobiales bacterium]|nr:imidazole glycerol phosphate synthase subunit HisH [Acidimicrobiales bacterium]
MTAATRRPVIAVLDYGIGNLHSAHKGFEHAGADARLTADVAEIRDADGVVLPGVGAYGPCMAALERVGLAEVAVERIDAGVPFFGICIGMQLLFTSSEEAPGVNGLGVFDRPVVGIPDSVKRPQMQWNVLNRRGDHPMFVDLPDESWMYFVHSYAAEDGDDVIATCDYGADLVAAVARDNVWACQFHPEKSGDLGIRILRNFVAASEAA